MIIFRLYAQRGPRLTRGAGVVMTRGRSVADRAASVWLSCVRQFRCVLKAAAPSLP